MRTTSEAPVAEPQPVQRAAEAAAAGATLGPMRRRRRRSGAAVEIRGLAHAFGALRVIERLDLAVEAGRGARHRRPLGLRQVDAARAGQRPARAPGRHDRGRGSRLARRAPRPLRVHAPARPAAALAGGDRQRGAGAAEPGRLARRGPPGRPPAVRALRAGGLRALAPRRALGRHAAANRLPAHAARRQACAAAGRAVRVARRDHPRRDAGVAGGGAGHRVAHGDPGHPRRRGGALPLRPRDGALRPARTPASPSWPRPSPEPCRAWTPSPRRASSSARERALAALSGGAR